jgi:hypothetical protein
MRDIDPNTQHAVAEEFNKRLATVCDALVERHGVEFMSAEGGHPDLDVLDFAINEAIRAELWVQHAVDRIKALRDASQRWNFTSVLRQQSQIATDLDMMGTRTRQLAFELIAARRLMQRLHGEQQGAKDV